MTGVRIRFSADERVLRSIGDEPNGLVGCGRLPDGFGFMVHGKVQPEEAGTASAAHGFFDIDKAREMMEREQIAPLALDAALDGAEGHIELACLWAAASDVVPLIAAKALAVPAFDAADEAVQFMRDLYAGIEARHP